MRFLLPILVSCCVACTSAEKERTDYLLEASEARAAGDWDKTRELLEAAVHTDPINLDARLRLADLYLVAYNEPEKARDLYIRTRKRSLARALFGLGRCALWEGQEAMGRDYLRRSLKTKPNVECAIALASRVSGSEREAILDLPLGGRRWQLFLVACGREEIDEKPPREASYALARARIATGEEQERELAAVVADACATTDARHAYARYLLGDTFFQRNPALLAVVKEGE